MKRLIVIVVLMGTLHAGAQLRFYREDLHFSLTDSTFRVDGSYFLRNESEQPMQQILYYPFPQDSLYGVIDTVGCRNLSRPDSARVLQCNTDGATLQVTIPAQDTTELRIWYTHRIKGGKAEYILTSTASWGRGFEQASYDLTFDKSIKIVSISYIPDDLEETETAYRLIWLKKDFMPMENFVVEFQAAGDTQ
jgi:hypothetical protein